MGVGTRRIRASERTLIDVFRTLQAPLERLAGRSARTLHVTCYPGRRSRTVPGSPPGDDRPQRYLHRRARISARIDATSDDSSAICDDCVAVNAARRAFWARSALIAVRALFSCVRNWLCNALIADSATPSSSIEV